MLDEQARDRVAPRPVPRLGPFEIDHQCHELTDTSYPVLSKNTNELKTCISQSVSYRRVYACFAKGSWNARS